MLLFKICLNFNKSYMVQIKINLTQILKANWIESLPFIFWSVSNCSQNYDKSIWRNLINCNNQS